MGVRHMQEVPTHLEYLHSNEAKKRHMSRCKNIIKPAKICDLPNTPYFGQRCGGSSHCDYYEEK